MTYEVMGIPAMAINKIIKFLWYDSFKSPQNTIKTFLIYFTDHQFDFFTHSIEQQKNRFTALMKY